MPKSTATTHRWVTIVIAILTLIMLTTGCSEERKIKKKAEWLCKNSQIEHADRDAFDDGSVLDNYLHPRDLEYLDRDEDDDAGDWGDFGAELEKSLRDIYRASRRVEARHIECAIGSVEVDEDRATLSITRTSPTLDISFDDLAELEDLSPEELEAKLTEWYGDADDAETDEQTLQFAKTVDGWRAYLGLEKSDIERQIEVIRDEIAEIDDDLKDIQDELEAIENARERLADFEVLSAQIGQSERRYMPTENYMVIEVQNNTDQPVSRVYFDATYQSSDRSVPWAADSMNYEISGGLEPGESAQWQLSPNITSDLYDVELRTDAELHLTVYRLNDPDGEALWEIPSENKDPFYAAFDDEGNPQERQEALEEERSELEAEIEGLEEEIAATGL